MLSWNEIEINTVGTIIFGVYLINSILIPKYLNEINPNLNEILVALTSGLIILNIEYFFQFYIELFVFYFCGTIDLFHMLKEASIVGGIGMGISNIIIHKTRRKRTIIPIVIFIIIWISISLVLRN